MDTLETRKEFDHIGSASRIVQCTTTRKTGEVRWCLQTLQTAEVGGTQHRSYSQRSTVLPQRWLANQKQKQTLVLIILTAQRQPQKLWGDPMLAWSKTATLSSSSQSAKLDAMAQIMESMAMVILELLSMKHVFVRSAYFTTCPIKVICICLRDFIDLDSKCMALFDVVYLHDRVITTPTVCGNLAQEKLRHAYRPDTPIFLRLPGLGLTGSPRAHVVNRYISALVGLWVKRKGNNVFSPREGAALL